jgi:hypothetical protein
VRIALASRTRECFVGAMFAATAKFDPPPEGVSSPLAWGSEDWLAKLFPARALRCARRHFLLKYLSPEKWLDFFRSRFGPLV